MLNVGSYFESGCYCFMEAKKVIQSLLAVKRVICCCAVFMVLVCIGAVTCHAAEHQSGILENGFSWSLNEEGKLFIEGQGKMPDFSQENLPPWYFLREQIVCVELANGISTIGDLSFLSCINLESVSFPNSLEQIGFGAFMACQSLAEITLPDKLETIDMRAFSACTSLERVALPSGLYKIDKEAFAGCPSLLEIDIPKSVEYIGEDAFGSDNNWLTITGKNNSYAIDFARINGIRYNEIKTEFDVFMEKHGETIVITVFLVILLTVIVSLYSSKKMGAEGPLAKEYMQLFPVNLFFYRSTCLLCTVIPVMALTNLEDVPWFTSQMSTIIEYIWIAGLAVCGCGWILTELIRRDFPWGIPRLIIRFGKLVMLFVAVAVVCMALEDKITDIVGTVLYFAALLFVPVCMIVIMSKIPWKPDEAEMREFRKLWKNNEENWKWKIEEEKESLFGDFYNTSVTGGESLGIYVKHENYAYIRNSNGDLIEVRPHGNDGMLVDDDGNYYYPE